MQPASVSSRQPHGRWRRYKLAASLAVCFVLVTAANALPYFFDLGGTGTNLIWMANGLLLSYLLVVPRWRWPIYLATGFAAMSTGSLLIDGQWRLTTQPLIALNLTEVLICAFLLRRRSTQLPQFTNAAYLIRFVVYGIVAGPLAAGSIMALISAALHHRQEWPTFLNWVVSDSMGIAVITPAFVAIFLSRFRGGTDWKRDWIFPPLFVLCTVAGFAQFRVPIILLLYPLLILILMRMGLEWAAMATLFAAGVGSWFTLHGIGPAAAMGFSYPGQPSIVMQSFIAVGMFMVYSVSAVLEKQQATERRLQEIATLHELVTENSRDVIILADLEGNRRYVAAASASMGGWTPQELIKHGSYAFVHPEDRAKAEEAVRRLRDGAETGTIEVRVSNKAGEYLWVEASLRVIRDPRTGKPNGVMNILRDISERKHAEQQLQDAYIALQALSALDSLTGVANRRRFDEYLAREWRRAIRDGKQISMLLVDVDHFKPYNDNYGHVRGDKCLKLVAEAAVDSVARPGDLVARYGGDEFIIVLVDTGKEGAIRVGNEICEGVRSRKLPHEISPIGIVSVSIGCATMVPKAGQDPASLIEVADEALYSAKRAGRDRVQGSNND